MTQMKLDEAKELNERQNNFESNPRDLQNTYEFFRLLNSHEMYTTLVRLYYKHGLKSHLENAYSDESRLIREQVSFAGDQLRQANYMG